MEYHSALKRREIVALAAWMNLEDADVVTCN